MELIKIDYLCVRCRTEHLEAVVEMTLYEPRNK